MIIEVLKDIRRVSLDNECDPNARIGLISRYTNNLLTALQAKHSDAANEIACRVAKLLPVGAVSPEVQEQIALLAEVFLEGANCHKLKQIGLVVHNHNLLVTQRLTRIESILGDQT